MTDRNLDEILRLLSDQYRRQTIQILRKTPEVEVKLDELIDVLIKERRANNERRDQIVIQLHHIHLPKLRERGVIDYDPDAQLVQYRRDQQVESIMDGISAKQSLSASDD